MAECNRVWFDDMECLRLAISLAELLRGRVQELELGVEVAAHEATIEMVRQRTRLVARELALIGHRQQPRGRAAVDGVNGRLALFQTSSFPGRSAARAGPDGGSPSSSTA